MRLFLRGRPALRELTELRWLAREQLEQGFAGTVPVYESAGLSVRLRFVYELPSGPLAVKPDLPLTPAASTLAWYWINALEGVLWTEAGQVYEVTARKEWGRVAGVEVIA